MTDHQKTGGGVEFAGLENDGLEIDGVEQSVIFQSVIFQSVIFQSCKFSYPVYCTLIIARTCHARQNNHRLRSRS